MRTSAILFMALVASAAGFFAGRASLPDPDTPVAEPTRVDVSNLPEPGLAAPHIPEPKDPRADLLRALELPAGERGRSVRLAMNAWLAADGAAAIAAAREDPELSDLVRPMMQLALYTYPQVFLDDPSLLEGIPNAERLIATAVTSIATFEPDVARALIKRYLSGSMHADAMLSSIDRIDRLHDRLPSAEDAYAELESILSERNLIQRRLRLHQLVARVAANDPAAAAELIDGLPRSSIRQAIGPLMDVWSQTNPEDAARWLSNKDAQATVDGLRELAQRWGHRDFESATAFVDTLTGSHRDAFLTGLSNATGHMSSYEMLAWMSRYEDEPVYRALVTEAAQRRAFQDIGAAVELIETLPGEADPTSYISVLAISATQDPEAAISVIDELENETLRNLLLPVVSSAWAQNDSESALSWALGLQRGPTRDQAIASIATSLMEFDMDRATDAIDEIVDTNIRDNPVRQLLLLAESDNEAIRLGRSYDFDRDAVLEIRALRSTMDGSFLSGGGSFSVIAGPIALERRTDPGPESD